MEFIIDQVTNYMNKAICKYADKKNIANPNMVQILFYLKKDGYAAVKMCENYKPVEEITFKQAINQRLDLVGLGAATEFFTQQALFDFCSSDNIKPDDISVMIIRKNDEEMNMHLYNNGVPVRRVDPLEIFDQSKIKTA
jgi:hypothetical protein